MNLASIGPQAAERALSATAASGGSVSAQEGADFSALLKTALEAACREDTLSLTAESPSGASNTPALMGGQLQGLLLGAAAQQGGVSDAQAALFMLLTLLGEEGGSGEMAPLLSLAANLVGQLDSDAQAGLYRTAMDSSADRAGLLAVERTVFSGLAPAAETQRTAAGAQVPTACWKPAAAALESREGARSPQALRAAIDQFDVGSSERYRPFRNGVTYCNIFVWDVTSALGCEIPHYVDAETGAPRSYPDIAGARELNANATADWLAREGPGYGWQEVTARQAQAWADQGGPAVTAWKNSEGRPGHVQVVCPGQEGGFDPVRGVSVAQAGAQVTGYTHIASTFKAADLKAVRYYIHA